MFMYIITFKLKFCFFKIYYYFIYIKAITHQFYRKETTLPCRKIT